MCRLTSDLDYIETEDMETFRLHELEYTKVYSCLFFFLVLCFQILMIIYVDSDQLMLMIWNGINALVLYQLL